MRAILDAGPLIGLLDEDDQHHSWARAIFKIYTGPYFTTEAVLTEAAHMTGQDELLLEGVRTGRFQISVDIFTDEPAIRRALQAYKDCGLTDATVIAVSEKFPAVKVLTTDKKHFYKYRRADKTPLPLETP
jgi:predicted nucleic acid-binding protein